MKRSFLLSLIAVSVIFAFSADLSAQSREVLFTKHSAYYGLSATMFDNPAIYGTNFNSNMPGIYGSYEACYIETPYGGIGAGGMLGYSSYTEKRVSSVMNSDGTYDVRTYNWKRLPILLSVSYHYNPLNKLDLYVKFYGGPNFGSIFHMDQSLHNDEPKKFSVEWGVEAGAIFMITKNFGVFAAGGYGLNMARAGIVFHTYSSKWSAFEGPSEKW